MREYYIDRGYVEASSYRLKVVKTLDINVVKTPTTIARECGIRPNHISKVLSELKDHNILVCVNEEARKGRLYALTDKGQKIHDDLYK